MCLRSMRPRGARHARDASEQAWRSPALAAATAAILALVVSGCARGTSSAAPGPARHAHAPPPAPGPAAASPSPPRLDLDRPIRRGGGSYKVGTPYQIAGRWYVPREEPGYDRVGTASWYGRDFHAKRTANGETFDMRALTAAHPTLPIPSYAYVTNLANGRTLLVRINDRGPYVGGRMIDLSRRVAELLGFEARGTTAVRVRYVGPAPLDGDETRETAFLLAQPWSRTAMVAPSTSRNRYW